MTAAAEPYEPPEPERYASTLQEAEDAESRAFAAPVRERAVRFAEAAVAYGLVDAFTTGQGKAKNAAHEEMRVEACKWGAAATICQHFLPGTWTDEDLQAVYDCLDEWD